MKTGIFIFTYGGDEAIARKNLEILQTVLENHTPKDREYMVFVVDDAANPWQTPPPHSPGVTYMKTAFPRGGNLNGRACVEGMVETMATVALALRLDEIIKLDSDTILLNPSFVHGSGYVGSSERVVEATYGYGSCYGMNRATALAVLALLKVLNGSITPENEDVFIGSLANAACGPFGFQVLPVDNGGFSRYWDIGRFPETPGYAVSTRPSARFKDAPRDDAGVLERMEEVSKRTMLNTPKFAFKK